MQIKTRLTGWKELKDGLKELPERAERNTIRGAIDQAARFLRDQVKLTGDIKDRTGNLRKSIKIRRKKPKPGVLQADVIATEFYGRFQENGFVLRTKSGSRHIPGKHFMKNAFLANSEKLLSIFQDAVKELTAKRLGKK